MLKDVKEKLGCACCFPSKNLNSQLEQLERALEEDDPRVCEKAEAFIEALNRQEAEAIRKETAVGDNDCKCNMLLFLPFIKVDDAKPKELSLEDFSDIDPEKGHEKFAAYMEN